MTLDTRINRMAKSKSPFSGAWFASATTSSYRGNHPLRFQFGCLHDAASIQVAGGRFRDACTLDGFELLASSAAGNHGSLHLRYFSDGDFEVSGMLTLADRSVAFVARQPAPILLPLVSIPLPVVRRPDITPHQETSMTQQPPLRPARDLAQSSRRFPGETPEYRAARNALLEQEIELRRLNERVAAQRRALPPGGVVPHDYRFDGEHGPVTLSQMFGEHDTLVTYNFMYGPQRKRPCPMCTSVLSAFDGEMPDILQRVAFSVIARSPIERILAFRKERGWRHLRLYSSGGNDFNRDYADEDPDSTGDNAGFNVFTRRDGVIRHTWGDEMGPESADPGQDPRGAPEVMPIWIVLDMTPGGRGVDWYPELEYPKR